MPARAVETDAYRGPASQGEQQRPKLAVEIDNQVVAGVPEAGQQSHQASGGGPTPAEVRAIAAGEQHHIRQGRMMADQLGVLGGDQPVDARRRIARRSLARTGTAWRTSPKAEGLIRRMRSNGLTARDKFFKDRFRSGFTDRGRRTYQKVGVAVNAGAEQESPRTAVRGLFSRTGGGQAARAFKGFHARSG